MDTSTGQRAFISNMELRGKLFFSSKRHDNETGMLLKTGVSSVDKIL